MSMSRPKSLSLRTAACSAACLWIVLAGAAQNAPAQTPEKPLAISATGQHELKISPERLRLTVTLRAEGLDAKTAIRALADHKTKVKNDLIALKAEEASINFTATRLTSSIAGVPAEAQQYGQRMIMQMMSSAAVTFGANGMPVAAQEAKPDPLPTVYVATASVRAEWPLPTTDLDALALLPETLKEQVKKRDLVGDGNKASFDATQQERIEEMQIALRERMGMYSSEEESPSVVVAFVAKPGSDARQAAAQAAFEQAVADADVLAAVAGKKRGPLVSLRYHDASGGLGEIMAAQNAAVAAFRGIELPTAAHDEVIGTSPDDLKTTIRVDAEFAAE